MMESAHSPAPPAPAEAGEAMPPTEEFDDPFSGGGENSENDNAAAVSEEGNDNNAEEADPWAVLAAAAGEDAPAPSPPTTTTSANNDSAADVPTIVADEHGGQQVTLSSAAGETFTMPDANNSSSHDGRPSVAAAIQSKLGEIDESIGLSTRAKVVDEQYHISEKWGNFNDNVLKPTTARTVEKTREVSSTVKEKVGPTVSHHWSGIKQRSVEMGIAQKWTEISGATRSKFAETSERVGESVGQWKEGQERKRQEQQQQQQERDGESSASGGGGGGGGIAGNIQPQLEKLQPHLEQTREKVAQSWAGGVSWVSQRIRDAKLSQERADRPAPPINAVGDAEMSRMDSDGLPSSFRR